MLLSDAVAEGPIAISVIPFKAEELALLFGPTSRLWWMLEITLFQQESCVPDFWCGSGCGRSAKKQKSQMALARREGWDEDASVTFEKRV